MKIKNLFCRHEYSIKETLSYYYDLQGHIVGNFRCECRKCGKERKIKYVVEDLSLPEEKEDTI